VATNGYEEHTALKLKKKKLRGFGPLYPDDGGKRLRSSETPVIIYQSIRGKIEDSTSLNVHSPGYLIPVCVK
jgi:hypothetical protein